MDERTWQRAREENKAISYVGQGYADQGSLHYGLQVFAMNLSKEHV